MPSAHLDLSDYDADAPLGRARTLPRRCLSNVCRHRAGRVAEGAGTTRSLACRHHGWRYALDGRLEHAREMDDAQGFPDNLQLDVVLPLGPRRTRTIFEWYAAPGLDEGGRRSVEAAIEFSDEVHREDVELCQEVQRGLDSAHYDRGGFAPLREAGVHDFQQLVSRFLHVD